MVSIDCPHLHFQFSFILDLDGSNSLHPMMQWMNVVDVVVVVGAVVDVVVVVGGSGLWWQ